jgi:hypothetical protein
MDNILVDYIPAGKTLGDGELIEIVVLGITPERRNFWFEYWVYKDLYSDKQKMNEIILFEAKKYK